MDFNEYQDLARQTDQAPQPYGNGIIIPLLGLAGEVGSLLTEYKKHLREGPAHQLFKDRLAEDIGDLLWYLANVATKFDLELDAIAQANLEKVANRWLPPDRRMVPSSSPDLFDDEFPQSEQLPRRFVAEVRESGARGEQPRARLSVDGVEVGDPLHDNAYAEDGYRFHDVLHLAHAAHFGWSPNLRAFLKRKRKSQPHVDQIEDGARARIIEEAIVAFVFEYAQRHDFLASVPSVDEGLLKTVRSLTTGLEVHRRQLYEWEEAILDGFRAWRAIRKAGGGKIRVDLEARSMVLIA